MTNIKSITLSERTSLLSSRWVRAPAVVLIAECPRTERWMSFYSFSIIIHSSTGTEVQACGNEGSPLSQSEPPKASASVLARLQTHGRACSRLLTPRWQSDLRFILRIAWGLWERAHEFRKTPQSPDWACKGETMMWGSGVARDRQVMLLLAGVWEARDQWLPGLLGTRSVRVTWEVSAVRRQAAVLNLWVSARRAVPGVLTFPALTWRWGTLRRGNRGYRPTWKTRPAWKTQPAGQTRPAWQTRPTGQTRSATNPFRTLTALQVVLRLPSQSGAWASRQPRALLQLTHFWVQLCLSVQTTAPSPLQAR